MMIIPVSELRRFQKIASHLKGKNILPILEYVKVQDGKLTKSISSAFVQMDIDKLAGKGEFLLDEKILSVKAGNTASPTLTIQENKGKITIKDDYTPTTFQSPKASEFPAIPQATSERFEMSENLLEVIHRASFFAKTMDPALPHFVDFIMIGNGKVAASDRHILFCEPVEENFQLVIDKNTAAIISKIPIKEYAYSDNYLFFYGDGLTLGFSKYEIAYTDFTNMAQTGETKMDFFVSAKDIRDFNAESMQSLRGDYVIVNMEGNKLSANNADLDISMEREFPTMKVENQACYNAELMNRLLDAIDIEEAQFFRGSGWWWIKSPDHKFTTMIMLLTPKN